MAEQRKLIYPYCTMQWANDFFAGYQFNEYWNGASPEKKESALAAATDFIDLFCQFYDEDDAPCFCNHSDLFEPDDPDDYSNTVNDRLIKQACAQEAAYLLSLDDNPAEPHPLTVLGLIRGDFGTVDPSLVPPIFPVNVVKLLEKLGGEIDGEAVGASGIKFFQRSTT